LSQFGKGRAKKVTEAVVLDNPKSGQEMPIDTIASVPESQLSVDKATVLISRSDCGSGTLC
jgi:hypothetical protein